MIIVKTEEQISIMKEGGRLLKTLIKLLEESICPGISTKRLDDIAYDFIISHNARPSFLLYNNYPASICTSINEVLIHGIPSEKVKLENGDIISIDCGIFYKGFHTDAARTFPVGPVKKEVLHLIQTAEKSFFEGIKFAKEGNRIGDISFSIEKYVASRGYVVVKEYVGHGIGKDVHEDPPIPNYGKPGTGPFIKKGMILAIEPMILQKSPRVSVRSDGWTVYANNNLPTAHYENTIVITETGNEIITM